MKSVSIADAKNRLPELVHASEDAPIQIMRRGVPVAVLVSSAHFERTRGQATSLSEAAALCRTRLAKLELEEGDPFANVRDRTPGRAAVFLK